MVNRLIIIEFGFWIKPEEISILKYIKMARLIHYAFDYLTLPVLHE